MFGLVPVYSVDGITDVTKWNYVLHKENVLKGKIEQNLNANGYRLPTVEEWRYAARGGEDFEYAGSNNIDEVAWHKGNSNDETHEVGKKKANKYGLYDMCGNVTEWCWNSSNNDNPDSLRGGAYYNSDWVSKGGNMSWDYCRHMGFRIVCNAE